MTDIDTKTRPPQSWRDAPFREAEFLPVDLHVEEDAQGVVRLSHRTPFKPIDGNLARTILAMADTRGDRAALAVRGPDGGWQRTSYAELARQIRGAAQWLIDTVPEGGVVVLMAENAVPVAALNVACWATGRILCPISPAYGMAGGDHARLRHVVAKVAPAVVFADPHAPFAAALDAVLPPQTAVVSTDAAPFGARGIDWADVIATEPTDAVAAAVDAIDPARPAVYMLTSGSTGLPKVVMLSLAAIAANTSQGFEMLGHAAGWDDDLLDWLPWHHAAGASVLRGALINGGTLHVDGGKPVPGLFDRSIANLREVSVAFFNNVPSGYALLVDAMDDDAELRATFFRRMRLMLYGGAGLPQHVFERLQAHAVAETGHRIHFTTGYGMTETVSGCLAIHFPTDRVGLGLPGPGVEVKLIPNGARYEVRLRGPNLMSGYLDDSERTAAAFDEEGYYRTGDMAVFHERARPEQGLAFAGRMAEEFKLANGSWVYGGQLREKLLKALADHVLELVIADDNRPYLGLLVWARPGAPADVLDRIADALRGFNTDHPGASERIRRVALLTAPPSADAHEVSDKGTINRRAVLDHRVAAVEALFADPPGDGVRVI